MKIRRRAAVDDGGLVWIKRGLACIKAASSVYQGSCVHPAGMVGVGGGWVGGSKQVGRSKAGGWLWQHQPCRRYITTFTCFTCLLTTFNY